MGWLSTMTVLIKYQRQNEITNKDWFERMENKNINWPQWGGWFDSDGSFAWNKKESKKPKVVCCLRLSEKSPVELFAKTFEANLTMSACQTNYEKSINTNSEKYASSIRGDRALWFCKKIHPYIINKNNKLNWILKNYNINLAQNYNNMTREEFILWLVSFMEGDGSFTTKGSYKGKYTLSIRLACNNKYLLNYIKLRSEKENILKFNTVYVSQYAGTKRASKKSDYMITRSTGYRLEATKDDNLLQFYEKIVPFMTLERKENVVLNQIEIIKSRCLV